MIKRLSTLRTSAASRPPGYVADVLSGATLVDEANDLYECTDEHWAAMVAKYRKPNEEAAPAPIQPIPYEDWPMAARVVRMMRNASDKGVGDTLERIAARMGAAWVAERYEALTGRSCGCNSRRDKANALYPY